MLVVCACTPLVKTPEPPVAAPSLTATAFRAADGAVLPIRRWLPTGRVRAVVAALHGFNDYSRFFDAAGQFLAQHGIASFAFDQRGFGEAPGWGLWAGAQAYQHDAAQFVRVLRAHYPSTPLYLLGESMGAAVAAAALASDAPPAVDGAIFVAPAVWAWDTMPWYQRWALWLGAHTVPFETLTGKRLHIRPSDNLEALRALGRDRRVIKATRIDAIWGLTTLMDQAMRAADRLRLPAFVLYGQRDQIIPKQPVFRWLERFPDHPDLKIGFYPQGYHLLLRDLNAATPLRDIVTWIDCRECPLPSGAERVYVETRRGGAGPAGGRQVERGGPLQALRAEVAD